MAKYLVSVQERHTSKVFAYMEVDGVNSYCARHKVRAIVERELKDTKKWDMLKDVDWCLDSVEI